MSSDPRLLRAFTVLARELHFGRAAALLDVTQPALSQQVRRLEDQLGTRLFARTRTSVELTEAGRAALPAALRAVEAADAVDAIVGGFARGERGELRVGLSPGVHYLSQAALARFQAARPEVRIRATHDSSGALARRVAAGGLHVAIGFCAEEVEGVLCEHLRDEPAGVAVPSRHRLASAGGPVSLAALAGERFALVDADDGAGYNRAVAEHCRAAGFEPLLAERPHGPMAWEAAVRTGGCVGLTTRSAAPSTARGVRLLPLEPRVTFPIQLVRPAGREEEWPPAAAAFADAARAAAA